MTVEEYLSQAYRLEQRIRLDMEELESLRSLSCGVSSPSFEEHYNPNQPTDATFVKMLERIWEKEEKVSRELEELIGLKEEIQSTINQLTDIDECLTLTYRYMKNYTWKQIGEELNMSERTIRRWHESALSHLVLPENRKTPHLSNEVHESSIVG